MTENPFPGLDVLVPLRWLLIATAVAALVFRRLVWIRVICILLALMSLIFGCTRIAVAPRMAGSRLQQEGKPWSEEFRDGSIYTLSIVWTAVPTFLLVGVVLAILASMPPKSSSTKNALTRNP